MLQTMRCTGKRKYPDENNPSLRRRYESNLNQ